MFWEPTIIHKVSDVILDTENEYDLTFAGMWPKTFSFVFSLKELSF